MIINSKRVVVEVW